VAGVISAVIVLITVLKLGSLFEELPTVSHTLKLTLYKICDIELHYVIKILVIIQLCNSVRLFLNIGIHWLLLCPVLLLLTKTEII